MRILIKSPDENKKINLIFPTRFVFNFVTATLSARVVGKYLPLDDSISSRDLRRFVKVIRRMKKKHPNMKLVDIESKDGEVVQISL